METIRSRIVSAGHRQHANWASLSLNIQILVVFWLQEDNSWQFSVWQPNSWLKVALVVRRETKRGTHLSGLHTVTITGHLHNKTLVRVNQNVPEWAVRRKTRFNAAWAFIQTDIKHIFKARAWLLASASHWSPIREVRRLFHGERKCRVFLRWI